MNQQPQQQRQQTQQNLTQSPVTKKRSTTLSHRRGVSKQESKFSIGGGAQGNLPTTKRRNTKNLKTSTSRQISLSGNSGTDAMSVSVKNSLKKQIAEGMMSSGSLKPITTDSELPAIKHSDVEMAAFKKAAWGKNYILNLDSKTLRHRQTQHYVGGYYKKLQAKQKLTTLEPLENAGVLARTFMQMSTLQEDSVTSRSRMLHPHQFQTSWASRRNPIQDLSFTQTFGNKQAPLGISVETFGKAPHLNPEDSIMQGQSTARDDNDATFHMMPSHIQKSAYDDAHCSIFQQLNLSVVASLGNEKKRGEDETATAQLKVRSRLPPPKHGFGETFQGLQPSKHDFDQTFQGTFPSIQIEQFDSGRDSAQQRPKIQECLSAMDSEGLFSDESQPKSTAQAHYATIDTREATSRLTAHMSESSHGVLKKKRKKQVKRIEVEPFDVVAGTNEDFEFRDFDSVKNAIRMNVTTQYREDEQKRADQSMSQEDKAKASKRNKRKRPDIKRKRSFTECMMQFDDGVELIQKIKDQQKAKGPNLMDVMCIEEMKKANRFPITEALLNKPKNYELEIDSFLRVTYSEEMYERQANFRALIPAPANSEESGDEKFLFDTSDEEQVNAENECYEETSQGDKKTEILNKGKKVSAASKLKMIDPELMMISNFDVAVLRDYPNKQKFSEVPMKVLKVQKLDYFQQVQQRIAAFFGVDQRNEYEDLKYNCFSEQMIQTIFEYFCLEFKAAPLNINKFIESLENGWKKVSFVNYALNEQSAKAIACILPFLVNVEEVVFDNNGLTDQIGGLVVMGVFMNPTIKVLRMQNNPLKGCVSSALSQLCRLNKDKLTVLALDGSISVPASLEKLVQNLHASEKLEEVNLSGCCFSLNTCRLMGEYLNVHGSLLRDLNLSSCKIGYQGTRSILNALIKNQNLRMFNISNNDLSSSTNEFAIKLGAMISRHPNLVHMDLSTTCLQREEVLFIGLALKHSQTMLSLHLTGNKLPYYERIFLRTVLSARVAYKSKNTAGQSKIKNNKEFNHVMHLTNGQNYNPATQEYIDIYNDLDQQREGLDFEIHTMLEEMDTEEQFENIQQGIEIKQVSQGTKLGLLLRKMKERNQRLIEQQETVQECMADPSNLKTQIQSLSGVRDLSKYNAEMDTAASTQRRTNKSSDTFGMMHQLKVERQRQRAELELIKEKKQRSRGEVALMFMGINQIASQILDENPMVNYMNSIVLTRTLGHDDIEEGGYWTDCTQCWICSRWNKLDISYHAVHDKEMFADKVEKLEQFQNNVHQTVRTALMDDGILDDKVELVSGLNEESSDEDKIDKFIVKPLETTQMQELMMSSAYNAQDDGITTEQWQVEKSVTPSNPTKISNYTEKPQNTRWPKVEINTQDPISPVKVKKKQVRDRIFPKNFEKRNTFKGLHLHHSTQNKHVEKQMKVMSMVKKGFGSGIQPALTKRRHSGIKPLTKNTSQNSSQQSSSCGVMEPSPIKIRRKVHGQPTLRERSIFYKGNVYSIEEELYSDSDKSSVYTSEDDFEEEEEMPQIWCQECPLQNEAVKEPDDEEDEYYGEEGETHQKTKQWQAAWPSYLRNTAINKKKIEDEKKQKFNALQENQKHYVNKLAPEHFQQSTADKRIAKFEGLEYIEAKRKQAEEHQKTKKRLMKKMGSSMSMALAMKCNKKLKEIIEQENEEEDAQRVNDIYFVASCCDWMPVKMKSKRRLALEKLNMQEAPPPNILNLDNQSVSYANFVQPGYHYFYFVEGAERVFLSPKYPIVRFKNSNVFLNRMTVKARQDTQTKFAIGQQFTEAASEELFLIEHSVFARYEREQMPAKTRQLRRAFDADMGYAKMDKLLKNDEAGVESIKAKIWTHFEQIKDIYLFEIGRNGRALLGQNASTAFFQRTDVVDNKTIDLATLDRASISTNVNDSKLVNSAERTLNRYEFIELLVRLALIKFKDQGRPDEQFEKLLVENIFPKSERCDGFNFRNAHMYHCPVNEIIGKNMAQIEKIHKSKEYFDIHQKKKFLTLAEVTNYVSKLDLTITEASIGTFYFESIIICADTVKFRRCEEMMPWEFITFICRATYEHYRNTDYHEEKMHIKLDKMLAVWLAPIGALPTFNFHEDFEFDKRVARKTLKMQKRAAGQDSGSESFEEYYDEEVPEDAQFHGKAATQKQQTTMGIGLAVAEGSLGGGEEESVTEKQQEA